MHVSDPQASRLAEFASRTFVRVETIAYLVLGMLLAVGALIGAGAAAFSLWQAMEQHGSSPSLVAFIDRLLFVLMVLEILHTVRVSFKSGTLVCEPFLIVGLIASIRRVLVITLESSQATQPGQLTAQTQALLESTMRELVVLGFLIIVMVGSIYLLRRRGGDPDSP